MIWKIVEIVVTAILTVVAGLFTTYFNQEGVFWFFTDRIVGESLKTKEECALMFYVNETEIRNGSLFFQINSKVIDEEYLSNRTTDKQSFNKAKNLLETACKKKEIVIMYYYFDIDSHGNKERCISRFFSESQGTVEIHRTGGLCSKY